MAHSYLSIDDCKEERSFGSSDGTIHIYMYFFLKNLEKDDLDSNFLDLGNEFITHYKEQLSEKYLTMIDLKLEEVYKDNHKLSWYLNRMFDLEKTLKSFGENIDYVPLNKAPEIHSVFTSLIPVKRLLSFINNMRWVLRVKGIIPASDGFIILHKVFDEKNNEWVDLIND